MASRKKSIQNIPFDNFKFIESERQTINPKDFGFETAVDSCHFVVYLRDRNGLRLCCKNMTELSYQAIRTANQAREAVSYI